MKIGIILRGISYGSTYVGKDFRLCVEIPIKAKKKKLILKSLPSYERSRISGKKNVNELKDGLLILFYLLKEFFKDNIKTWNGILLKNNRKINK